MSKMLHAATDHLPIEKPIAIVDLHTYDFGPAMAALQLQPNRTIQVFNVVHKDKALAAPYESFLANQIFESLAQS